MAGKFFGPIFASPAVLGFEQQASSSLVKPPEFRLGTQSFDIVGIFHVHPKDFEGQIVHQTTLPTIRSASGTRNSPEISFGNNASRKTGGRAFETQRRGER